MSVSSLATLAPPLPDPPGMIIRALPDTRPPGAPWPPLELVPSASPEPHPSLFDLPIDDGLDVGLRPVRAAPRSIALLVEVPGAPQPRPDLPDPLTWCCQLTPGLVEVLLGRRSPAQLVRWFDEPVLAALTSELKRRTRGRPATFPPATVASVRLQCATPEAIEVAVRLRTPTRSIALAYRLRAEGRHWVCCVLDVGDGAVWNPS